VNGCDGDADSDDRVVHGDQFGAVRERGFHLISGIISATPSITSSRASTVVPSCISSATVRPSRAPSMMAAVISATASG
jgi:hypothetical protein